MFRINVLRINRRVLLRDIGSFSSERQTFGNPTVIGDILTLFTVLKKSVLLTKMRSKGGLIGEQLSYAKHI